MHLMGLVPLQNLLGALIGCGRSLHMVKLERRFVFVVFLIDKYNVKLGFGYVKACLRPVTIL